MEHILNKAEEIPQASPLKPKLTMKLLHVQLQDIQLKNELLVNRVIMLEQQLGKINQNEAEIAVTIEQSQDAGIHEKVNQDAEIRVSRVDRHAPPRKKHFWFLT